MKLRWFLLPLLLLAAGCLLIPDDQEKGARVENQRPLVQITAGAATSDSSGIDYKVSFQWRGADGSSPRWTTPRPSTRGEIRPGSARS